MGYPAGSSFLFVITQVRMLAPSVSNLHSSHNISETSESPDSHMGQAPDSWGF